MQPLLIFGALALIHAAYSSYEWVSLHKMLGETPSVSVPRDVVIEIFIGLALVMFSAVSHGVGNMFPEYVATNNIVKSMEGEEPFAYLETRPNFQDLVARRQEYLRWRKEQSSEKPSDSK